jgi:hypothetical protein
MLSNDDDMKDEAKEDGKHHELFILTDSTELNSLKKENEDLKKRLAEMELLLKKKHEVEDLEVEEEDKKDDVQEIEPNLESYQRDYDKDIEMEKIFNELF